MSGERKECNLQVINSGGVKRHPRRKGKANMPYFITQTKSGVNIKHLRLTIEPREHREKHGARVFPKCDVEEGGGLHVYFNVHGAYWLPEAIDSSGKSVYLGGELNEEQTAKWLDKLRSVATWLTPKKAQKIYGWLTDPLPNIDGSKKTLVQRKYPENESFAMTNGYQINLGDADKHWKLRGSIEHIQSLTSVRVGEDLAKSQAEQRASFLAAEAEAKNSESPPTSKSDEPTDFPPDELPGEAEIKPVYKVPESKPEPKRRGGWPKGRSRKG